jgi:hypothetical protein
MAGLLILVFVLCVSCGLETYVYLYPAEIVYNPGTNTATIWLPSQSAPEFSNYVIYYRIYLSNSNVFPVAEGQLGGINTALNSHYSTLYPYTTNDTVSSVSLDSVFSRAGYYSLDVEGSTRLSSLLTNNSTGTVMLNFAPSTDNPPYPYPRVTIDSGTPLNLRRNSSAGLQPNEALDQLFFSNFAGVSTTNNANSDIEPRTGAEPTLNAYVSLYVLAAGIDSNYSPVYSRPTHAGLFILPK